MSKTVKIVITTAIVLIIGIGLVYTGVWIGRYGLNPFSHQMSTFGWGMHSEFGEEICEHSNYSRGHGMMGQNFINTDQNIPQLTMDEVERSIDQYLENLSDPDLILSEIMIFDNHAYAQIIEESTGIGAMEVLVDPVSKQVYLEQGPNMMWNLKYSSMSGMMMGSGPRTTNSDIRTEDMTVTSDEAVAAAQTYLDQYQQGNQADEHADIFYGYYTLHVLNRGEIVGMLSVNGDSGQVFYHKWHGELIEMSEH